MAKTHNLPTPAQIADLKEGLETWDVREYVKTLQKLKRNAKQGDANAQHDLGLLYIKGQDVPRNSQTALKWFRLAAKQGFARAQYNLGAMYANGLGVPLDYPAALNWFRLAAAQGLAEAQSAIDAMYAEGRGAD